MRLGLFAVLFGTWGCTFQPGSYGDSVGDPATAPDARAADHGTDAPPAATRTCAFADPSLRLCLDFEDHSFVPRATDASPMHLDATTHDVTGSTHDDSVAAQLTPASGILVPEAAALDLTQALTIEIWVRPAYNQYATLVDNARQYTLSVTPDGRASCALPGGYGLTDSDKVDTGSWTHLACTYGPSGSLAIYVNGELKATTPIGSGGTSSAGTSGTKIGSGFGGRVDDVKLFAREATADEICAHSGHSSCAD